MGPRRATSILAGLLAAAALATGCGGSGSSSGGGGGSGGSAESMPAPLKSDFPSAAGKSLAEVMKAAEGPAELVVTPAAMVFYKGENRFPFGVFHKDHSEIPDARVALYFAKAPAPAKSKGGAAGGEALTEAGKRALDAPAVGPFPAAIESLAVKPAFRSRTTATDPNAASVVYVTHVNFPSDGEWRVAALIEEGGKLTAKLLPSAVVGEFSNVPRAGRRAPLIHTPTAAGVGGDLAKITTRVPPDTQNKVDYAEVFGKKPIVLLFATPEFCQSRVCGPVVDVAEQVKQAYGNRVAFIHMEIYNDNDPNRGVRPQVRAFHLPSEPWAFAIDRHGTIGTALEGAFGVDELTHAVEGVAGE
ncbi:MAG TPA: hypothetical protein VFP23_03455 [Solirubrobacterales bacterium]|nr:hypothetical protein [Solirubrobacterales bacterium]